MSAREAQIKEKQDVLKERAAKGISSLFSPETIKYCGELVQMPAEKKVRIFVNSLGKSRIIDKATSPGGEEATSSGGEDISITWRTFEDNRGSSGSELPDNYSFITSLKLEGLGGKEISDGHSHNPSDPIDRATTSAGFDTVWGAIEPYVKVCGYGVGATGKQIHELLTW